MTLRKAIYILMEAAVRDAVGAGCGMRSIPTGDARKELADALDRAHRFLYRCPAEGRYKITRFD